MRVCKKREGKKERDKFVAMGVANFTTLASAINKTATDLQEDEAARDIFGLFLLLAAVIIIVVLCAKGGC
jgi:hypothetical protein